MAVAAAERRRRRGGDGLFEYRDSSGWTSVRSEDVNGYVKAALGTEYTAKDFRTWSATVLVATTLATSGPIPTTRTAHTARIRDASGW